MTRFITSFAVVAALSTYGLSTASADHQQGCCCCPCPCPCVPAAQAPHDQAPPVAPPEGDTQQSQSVEPQTAPPSAPQNGTTVRNYSVQPAPAYRYAPQRSQRVPFEPESRKQHPTARFLR